MVHLFGSNFYQQLKYRGTVIMEVNGKSLDLGCNNRPRNPYNYEELFGIGLHPCG
jgi:hypothetical protein